MFIEESMCVDCDLPCLQNACPYYKVRTPICDRCGDYAEYRFHDEDDFCESCAYEYLEEAWNDYSIENKAEMLEIQCTTY